MASLSPWRQQAITWANVDPDLCRHMASLGPNELIYLVGIWVCCSEDKAGIFRISLVIIFISTAFWYPIPVGPGNPGNLTFNNSAYPKYGINVRYHFSWTFKLFLWWLNWSKVRLDLNIGFPQIHDTPFTMFTHTRSSILSYGIGLWELILLSQTIHSTAWKKICI